MNELINAVRAHANQHWGKAGWDILAECWDDEDIGIAIGSATTPKTAIAACKRRLRTLYDYREEIRSTADW